MDTNIIIVLICSGLLVGFINTLAGGGTIISLKNKRQMGTVVNPGFCWSEELDKREKVYCLASIPLE